ncbi:MAG: DUF1559 domain-containing protein [Armatimonadota bacterium]|nr:DUF1559 domain-containing protein [Armatimonadota bacterium]
MQRKPSPVLILLFVFAITLTALFLCPHSLAARESSRKAGCQSNMKEIALAFSMYMSDYDDTLPSSAISRAPERTFRSTLGRVPPPRSKGYKAKTVFELLYPYRRNRDVCFCESDPTAYTTRGFWVFKKTIPRKSLPPSTPTSYVLKKAINDAWLDPKIKARKEIDFNWPSEQIMFYERRSFHWGDRAGDVSDPKNTKRFGASINCVFMDTHVKTHRITEFEPDYYNTNPATGTPTKRPQINPRMYCDRLP